MERLDDRKEAAILEIFGLSDPLSGLIGWSAMGEGEDVILLHLEDGGRSAAVRVVGFFTAAKDYRLQISTTLDGKWWQTPVYPKPFKHLHREGYTVEKISKICRGILRAPEEVRRIRGAYRID